MANRNYYKLVNGKLEQVPINKDGTLNYFADTERIVEDGYKKLIKTERPGYPYTLSYKETAKQIKEVITPDTDAIRKNEESHRSNIDCLRLPKDLFISEMQEKFNIDVEVEKDEVQRDDEITTSIITENELDENEIDNMFLELNHLI